jgi:hypothetical protein
MARCRCSGGGGTISHILECGVEPRGREHKYCSGHLLPSVWVQQHQVQALSSAVPHRACVRKVVQLASRLSLSQAGWAEALSYWAAH